MTPEGDSELTLSSSAAQAVGPYLQAVRRHWRLVALVALLAVVVAAATVERSGKTYSADASILVTPLPEGDSGFVGIATVFDNGDPAATVQTAAALVDTPNAAALAARQLGKPWTTGTVSAAVTVTPRGASDVLAVTGQASTAADAARVANAFAASAIAYRAGIVQQQIQASITRLDARLAALLTSAPGSAAASALATAVQQLSAVQGPGREPTMSVSQVAQPPGSPSGASTTLIVLLALIGGFALGSIGALGLETFSRPLRDWEEITTLYPLPVLATLPEIEGQSERGTPPWAIPPLAFEQLRILRVQLSLSDIGRVIMVTSAGAGDGKTTVAAALAAAFAEAEMTVTLMDLDMRKPGLEGLLEVSISESRWSPAGFPVPRLPGVCLIPPPSGGIAEFGRHLERLPTLLLQAGTADVVIIDTAPVGEVSETLRIASICDQVLFVARPRFTDRRRLVLARDLLARVERRPVGLVLVGKETGHPPRGRDVYAYSYSMPTGSPTGQSDKRPAAVSSARADADELDLD
jgi:Mrp family chromosome partitioning ATPase/capsular polysaccharide biosynthesis protein